MTEPTQNTTSIIKATTVAPAPPGLLGFSMITVLLNLCNVGLDQVVAGILAWRKPVC